MQNPMRLLAKIKVSATKSHANIYENLVEIDGVGTNAITISLSGAQEGLTAIVSEGGTIDEDDIEFV